MNYSLNPPRVGDKNYNNYNSSMDAPGSMAEILAMMKKQGMNVDGFEAEAEDIWKGLDEMSANDPDEYRKFIQNQYQESKNDTASSKTAPNQSQSRATEKESAGEDRFFRPNVGFSIKSRTSGGDGLQIRGDGDGKDLYINFCHHPAIEAPLDRHGKAVEMKDFYRLRPPDGLQIPLILGPLRDINNKAIAVDAVFNEKVIDCCVDPPESKNTGRETLSGNKAMALFKQQIVELACDWITRDTGVTFSKSWVDCSVRYSEGRGNDKLTPVLFSVNHANGQSNDRKVEGYANSEDGRTSNNFLGSGSGRGARGQAIRSPSSLLSAIRNSSAEEQQNIDYTVGGTNSVNTENRQGMEVISGNCHGGGNNTLDSNSSSSSRTSKMAMTKGFLDSAKVRERPIYPASGSVEGSGGSRGGSLARVMDKCLVINPSSLSQEQSRRASENSSGSSRVGSNAHSDISSSSTNAVSGVTEVSHSRAEPEPTAPTSSLRIRGGGGDLIVDNMLKEGTDCTWKETISDDGNDSLTVTVTGIDSNIFDVHSLDLQVSSDQILVTLALVGSEKSRSGVRTLRFAGFRKGLTKDSAKAKLSKKKKTLTIDVQCS